MSIALPTLSILFIYGLLGFSLYWIIRLAVRHALQDHDRKKESTHGSQ